MAELKGTIGGNGMGGSIAGRGAGGGAVPLMGKSAYELAVAQGFDGTLEEWLLSLRGNGIERIGVAFRGVDEEGRNYTQYRMYFTNGDTFDFTVTNGKDGGSGGGGGGVSPTVDVADIQETIPYTHDSGLVAIPEGTKLITVRGTCSGLMSGGSVYFVLVDGGREIIANAPIGSGSDDNILDVFVSLDVPEGAAYIATFPYINERYTDSKNNGYYCDLTVAFTLSSGVTITITDVNGVKSFNLYNGKDGEDGLTPHIGANGNWWLGETDTGVKAEGKDGADGKTPYIQNGYWYIDGVNTNVKAEGKDGEDGKDGTNGKDGANGIDGVSPTISVSTITGGHRITITDKNETKTVDIMDGSDGADGSKGADGRGIKTVARTSGTGAAGTTDTYTITYTDNTTSTFTVYNGKDGADGADGNRGTGILKVSTELTTYTTSTGGKNPIKRMKLSTIKDEADVSEVLVGDIISRSYYLYHIYYIDATYAYIDTYTSIRGATGSKGEDGADGASVTVSNVSESTADGGSNVVTFSDGKTLTVKNGSKGDKGDKGDPYTLNDSDKQTIVNAVIAALPKYAGEVS